MSESATFAALYVGMRPMKTQPVIKLELEVPLERANDVMTALGWPPGPGETKWVGVCRLDPSKFEK